VNPARVTVCAALLLAAFGCASIVSRTDYPITVDSNPSGARIVITNDRGVRVFEGTTPATIELSSRKAFFQGASYTIEASREGYAPGVARLNARIDSWYFGNVVFGGLIGMLIVDPSTGAMWSLDERVMVDLGAGRVSLAPRQDELVILGLEDLSAEQRARMVPID